jgi:hypothetical protein
MSEAVYPGPSDDLEAFLALFNRLDTFFAEVIADTKANATGSIPRRAHDT